jgi:phospholipid-binding lipoprotein MlaA
MRKLHVFPAACGLVALLFLGGCATQNLPLKRDPRDPFERANRSVYRFNDAIDRAVAKPVARAYVKITPQPIRRGVSNFFSNLSYPVVIVNDLLQGKIVATSNDIVRFVVNTTVGIGGIFDPASKAGLAKNDEDFGQTLGRWGVHTGPYLVLPLFGPSDLRDGIGRIADRYTEPLTYDNNWQIDWTLRIVGFVDLRARLLQIEKPLEGAYDPYAVLRSVYLQRRNYLVHDGDVPDDTPEEEPLPDDAALGENPAPSAPPPPGAPVPLPEQSAPPP